MFRRNTIIKRIIEKLLIPVTVYDIKGNTVYSNSASDQLFESRSVQQQLISSIISEGSIKEVEKKIFVHKKRNGEQVLVLATCISLSVEEDYSGYVVFSDIIGGNHFFSKGLDQFFTHNVHRNPVLLYDNGMVEVHNSAVMGYLGEVVQLDEGNISGDKVASGNTYTHQNMEGLTRREADILKLVYKGLTVKEVSKELSISVNTIKTHLKKIYRKLSVQNRMQLLHRIIG